jgi:hypothetical protein
LAPWARRTGAAALKSGPHTWTQADAGVVAEPGNSGLHGFGEPEKAWLHHFRPGWVLTVIDHPPIDVEQRLGDHLGELVHLAGRRDLRGVPVVASSGPAVNGDLVPAAARPGWSFWFMMLASW